MRPGNITAAQLRKSIDDGLIRLAQAMDDTQASDEMRRYLDAMARFHRYRWHNTLLIAARMPLATRVAGFRTWKQLGRRVRKGESAIRIIAPCPVRREAEDPDDKDKPRMYFKAVCVFDVSQTEGKALPGITVPDVSCQADGLLRRFEGVAAKRGIAVQYGALGRGTYGVSRGGQVEIAHGHATGQRAKTLAHELAHLCCAPRYVLSGRRRWAYGGGFES